MSIRSKLSAIVFAFLILAAPASADGIANPGVVAGGDLGTPSAIVLTNATGTASGLTAGNVTTNANLTGVITSVGNATSINSQTGTGSTFVMSASPTGTGTWALPIVQATSLAIGGATIGTNALAVTGTAAISGTTTVGAINGSTFLSLQVGANEKFRLNTSGQLVGSTAGSSVMVIPGAVSSTVPGFIPVASDPTTGIGAQAAGNISLIVGGVEAARVFGSLTGSQAIPAMSITQAWNTTGANFAALNVNVTKTASGSGTMLAAFQTGGANKFRFYDDGNWDFGTGTFASVGAVGVSVYNTAAYGWSSGGSAGSSLDTYLSRGGAAATVQLGVQNVASGAVAQTLTFQGNTGSTTNGPLSTIRAAGGGSGASVGAELRLIGGLSSAAAGTGGAVSIYTAPAAAGNAAVLAFQVDAPGTVKLSKGFTIGAGASQLPAAGTAGRYAYVTDQLTTCAAAGAALVGGGAVTCPVFDNGVAWVGG